MKMPRVKAPKAPKVVAASTIRIDVSSDTPMGHAKDLLIKGMARRGGAFCPCCGQQSTIYQRNVNASIALVMYGLAMWREVNGPGFANIPNVIFKSPELGVAGTKAGQGGQWAQAVFWDLVERERGQVRADGSNRTGFARVTDRGLAFLAGKYRIRKYALVYDGVLLGKAGDLVSIADVQDLAFDFASIFAGRSDEPGGFQDEPLFVNKDHFLDVSPLVYGDVPPRDGSP
jgi:hypothetical protein